MAKRSKVQIRGGNAAQRRKARRAQGIRGPYRCVWCSTVVQGLGKCPGCGEILRPLGEMKLTELGSKAYRHGFELKFEIKDPKTEVIPTAPDAGEFILDFTAHVTLTDPRSAPEPSPVEPR